MVIQSVYQSDTNIAWAAAACTPPLGAYFRAPAWTCHWDKKVSESALYVGSSGRPLITVKTTKYASGPSVTAVANGLSVG